MVEFVDINGARLAYRICGPDHAPLMITLHGGRGMGKSTISISRIVTSDSSSDCYIIQTGDHRSDFAIYSKLSDQLRVLSFDFRGHGQSSRTRPYTFEQIVDDIEGLRKHFAVSSKVIICGGSFGGFLAQHYAIKYASHVSHLILRGTAASHHRKFSFRERLR